MIARGPRTTALATNVGPRARHLPNGQPDVYRNRKKSCQTLSTASLAADLLLLVGRLRRATGCRPPCCERPKLDAEPRKKRAPQEARRAARRARKSDSNTDDADDEAGSRGRRRRTRDRPGATVPVVAADDEYLTTDEAGAYLKLAPQTLEAARYKADGSGPPYIKLPRAVRYRRSQLDAWMAEHDHPADRPTKSVAPKPAALPRRPKTVPLPPRAADIAPPGSRRHARCAGPPVCRSLKRSKKPAPSRVGRLDSLFSGGEKQPTPPTRSVDRYDD